MFGMVDDESVLMVGEDISGEYPGAVSRNEEVASWDLC